MLVVAPVTTLTPGQRLEATAAASRTTKHRLRDHPDQGTSRNVRASFGVFSYDGTSSVTAVTGANLAGELPELTAPLQIELDELSAMARQDRPWATHDASTIRCEVTGSRRTLRSPISGRHALGFRR